MSGYTSAYQRHSPTVGLHAEGLALQCLSFLWRLVLSAMFAFSTSLTDLTEIALLSFLTVHIMAQPYKRRIYNIIDPLMIVNMAIINSLSWFVCAISTESEGGGTAEGISYCSQAHVNVIALLMALCIVAVLSKDRCDS